MAGITEFLDSLLKPKEERVPITSFLDSLLKKPIENELKAPPRNPLVAPQADLAKKVKEYLNRYETKKLGKIDSPWNRFGAGHNVGDLLLGQSPEMLDDVSYGLNPLISGGHTGRIPIPDKRLLDAPLPIPGPGGAGVIKNKGGNWLTGSVENALKRLKRPGKEEYENVLELLESGDLTPDDVNLDLEKLKGNIGINDWIDTTLTKYVKNRMATPEDEVRKLADEGVLHTDPTPWIDEGFETRRGKTGFPPEGIAKSELGHSWEDLADDSIGTFRPKDLVDQDAYDALVYPDEHIISKSVPIEYKDEYVENLKKRIIESLPLKDQWIAKMATDGRDAPIYDLSGSTEGLGFDHLVDELNNMLDPNSGLPMNLRLTPEGLKGLSMEEAVKKVHQTNQFRAKQAEIARKKLAKAEGIPVQKEYEDGWRWLAPDDVTKDPKAKEYVKNAGNRSAWCTQGDGTCEHYAGGDSRIKLLVDPEGNPHVQVGIEYELPKYNDFTLDEWESLTNTVKDHAGGLFGSKFVNADDFDSVYYYAKANDLFPKDKIKQNITQLKPIGNSWNSSKVNELMGKDPSYKKKVQSMMQDFVKSGNWADVGDLKNAGLRLDPRTKEYIADYDYLLSDPKYDKDVVSAINSAGSKLFEYDHFIPTPENTPVTRLTTKQFWKKLIDDYNEIPYNLGIEDFDKLSDVPRNELKNRIENYLDENYVDFDYLIAPQGLAHGVNLKTLEPVNAEIQMIEPGNAITTNDDIFVFTKDDGGIYDAIDELKRTKGKRLKPKPETPNETYAESVLPKLEVISNTLDIFPPKNGKYLVCAKFDKNDYQHTWPLKNSSNLDPYDLEMLSLRSRGEFTKEELKKYAPSLYKRLH